jgi:SAM-dependent methyltransferase
MWEEDIRETRERYSQRWKQHGYSPLTLGWNKGLQEVRFEAALETLGFESCASVLDVGCGFGDLFGYLHERGWNGTYTGVDLVPELIEEARSRWGANARFECLDISAQSSDVSAYLVLAIGIFNHRLHQPNLDFFRTMFEAMWSRSKGLVVCDFLSSTAEPGRRQPNLFYADPSDIYKIASSYSRRIQIHHAYMPFEFQLKVWRDDSFTPDSPVFTSDRGTSS